MKVKTISELLKRYLTKTITLMLGYGASMLLANYKIIRAPLTQPTFNLNSDVGLRRVYAVGELSNYSCAFNPTYI